MKILLAAVGVALVAFSSVPVLAQTSGLKLITTINAEGKPLKSFDIGVVDKTAHRYYLSDRTNAGVDVFDTESDKYVGRGGDEVTYNSSLGQYYVAANHMPGGPVLGVIDAKTNKWIENLSTSKESHSVATDDVTDRVYAPADSSAHECKGCVLVFGK